MSDDPTGDAAIIERDIDRTQDRMGDTVEKLEERLTPPKVAESLIGSRGSETAEQALEVAKRNPIPVALIAIGAVWLVASRRSRSAVQALFAGRSGRSPRSAKSSKRTSRQRAARS
jgi:hypothetical protein